MANDNGAASSMAAVILAASDIAIMVSVIYGNAKTYISVMVQISVTDRFNNLCICSGEDVDIFFCAYRLPSPENIRKAHRVTATA